MRGGVRVMKVAQGQRHTQAETKPTSLTLHISLLEARDLALGRGSQPVCTEAHTAARCCCGVLAPNPSSPPPPFFRSFRF